MNTYASEGKEKKSTTSYHRSNQDGAFQSEDTRSEAIQMQHIQELANNSLQSPEIFQLQAMADNFIIQRESGDQERKNNRSEFKESWSKEEEAFAESTEGSTLVEIVVPKETLSDCKTMVRCRKCGLWEWETCSDKQVMEGISTEFRKHEAICKGTTH